MRRSLYGIQPYLRDVASWVWHEQGAARHHGLKLQEETITETLLLRMARECQHLGLRVRMFNRIEEGGRKKTTRIGNGADWEWYVTTDYCRVGFRVQAKVLSSELTKKGALSIGKYKGLLDDRKQTSALIKDAAASKCNPIYVFYNHSWVSDRAIFSSSRHAFPVVPGDWGCAVAKAAFVQSQTGNNLSTLIRGMLPWHKFFGIHKGCVSQRAMHEMEGNQEFIPETPPPAWLDQMSEGEEGLNQYLVENRLRGVAHLDFSKFEG